MTPAIYYAQEPEGWLLLTGTYGCGKTHLAAAIANARLAMGEPPSLWSCPTCSTICAPPLARRATLSYDDLFEQLRNTPLLILDDLGTQSSTPWAQEKLFQLLNHRYNRAPAHGHHHQPAAGRAGAAAAQPPASTPTWSPTLPSSRPTFAPARIPARAT